MGISQPFKFLFFSKNGIRLVWVILAATVAIVLGEKLIVDPLASLFPMLGLSEVSTSVAQDWPSALGDSIKRLLRSGVVVVSVWLIFKLFHKGSFERIGFNTSRNIIRDLLLGISLGFVVQGVALLIMAAMGWYEVVGYSWEFNPVSFFAPALLFTIVYCAETGIIEEVIFRGLIFNIFENRYSTTVGVVISSLLFGILHFSGFEGEFAWWLSITSAVAAGILFAQAFLLFRSLWLPIALHAGWHLAYRTLGTVGLKPDEAIFLVTDVNGPPMMISTREGGAGVSELLGLIVVSIIMWLIRIKLQSKMPKAPSP